MNRDDKKTGCDPEEQAEFRGSVCAQLEEISRQLKGLWAESGESRESMRKEISSMGDSLRKEISGLRADFQSSVTRVDTEIVQLKVEQARARGVILGSKATVGVLFTVFGSAITAVIVWLVKGAAAAAAAGNTAPKP